jgi:schlafen family protein
MPAFYRSTVQEFLSDNVDVVGVLAQAKAAAGFFSVERAQIEAWHEQAIVLKSSLSDLTAIFPEAHQWTILLEFSIPRRQRRIDAVLLARDIIFVLEFKTGIGETGWSAARQAEDYVLELFDFHLPSRDRTIIPIVVAAKHKFSNTSATEYLDHQVTLATPDHLAQVLLPVYRSCSKPEADTINCEVWDKGMYRPVPTIIEAATALYSGTPVREIAHAHSGSENLNATTEFILAAAQEAQSNNEKVICFVTGIPGAGKTLAGLNLVHNRELQSGGQQGLAFMSGNSPLVKILREALVTEFSKQSGTSKKQARRKVSAFIQNIHQFVEDNLDREESEQPHEHFIVFDEAQRAWDAEHNEKRHRKKGSRWHVSEPEMVLSIMNRHAGWAVVVALVGGGQEIHQGEAGLAEWGRTLKTKYSHWHVFASPEALDGGDSVAGSVLFSDPSLEMKVNRNTALHLKTCIRSYKAERLAEWVNRVLNGDSAGAEETSKSFARFPVMITRDLREAKDWVRNNTRGMRRCGFVASSGAARLRAFGIETSKGFRDGYSYTDWFLKPPSNVRSSFQLEVAATEFEIQGLELDNVAMCWGGDFVWNPKFRSWFASEFKGTRWLPVRSPDRYERIRNKYRVLLTRSRERLVIWVPTGNENDATLRTNEMDNTFHYLLECGARVLE